MVKTETEDLLFSNYKEISNNGKIEKLNVMELELRNTLIKLEARIEEETDSREKKYLVDEHNRLLNELHDVLEFREEIEYLMVNNRFRNMIYTGLAFATLYFFHHSFIRIDNLTYFLINSMIGILFGFGFALFLKQIGKGAPIEKRNNLIVNGIVAFWCYSIISTAFITTDNAELINFCKNIF